MGKIRDIPRLHLSTKLSIRAISGIARAACDLNAHLQSFVLKKFPNLVGHFYIMILFAQV